MRPKNHLVIFAKSPEVGRVKSRLAAEIGWVAATMFQRRLLHSTVRALYRDRRWRCWLAVTPDSSRLKQGLWPKGAVRIGQGPGNLGRRLTHVARSLPPGPVVVIGSDVPSVTPERIARAFGLLGRHDVVLGPSSDGGYWLIGEKRRPHRLSPYSGVRWSTPAAFSDTLDNLAGYSVGLVEALDDVDDGAAWARWRRNFKTR